MATKLVFSLDKYLQSIIGENNLSDKEKRLLLKLRNEERFIEYAERGEHLAFWPDPLSDDFYLTHYNDFAELTGIEEIKKEWLVEVTK